MDTMTNKKIMLVEAGSVRHRYLWHEFGDTISSGSNE